MKGLGLGLGMEPRRASPIDPPGMVQIFAYTSIDDESDPDFFIEVEVIDFAGADVVHIKIYGGDDFMPNDTLYFEGEITPDTPLHRIRSNGYPWQNYFYLIAQGENGGGYGPDTGWNTVYTDV